MLGLVGLKCERENEMGQSIEPLMFDSVMSIAFINHGRGDDVVVWVCESPKAYKDALERLAGQKHCKIIHKGASVIVREES